MKKQSTLGNKILAVCLLVLSAIPMIMEKEATGAEVLLPKEIRFDCQGGDHQETSQAEVNAWINALKKELL